jgi:transposase-like protein
VDLAYVDWREACELRPTMPSLCPHCKNSEFGGSIFVRFGFFYRTCDSRWIQRYRCRSCRITCSRATFSRWFRQKKRSKNEQLRRHFASTGTIRRAARTFTLNRKTVERKLMLLGFEAEAKLRIENLSRRKVRVVEIDDMETFEHTKCKPLSITLAVQKRTRRILALEVSSMPAKGLLSERARRKYGHRLDARAMARAELFGQLQDVVHEKGLIKSDKNPHYVADVVKFFPHAKHIQFQGRRPASTGQGEIKKGKFDPLFALNHTCAMFRANVSRLVRKTWVTTKRADRLRAHLFIYADYHNQHLKKR